MGEDEEEEKYEKKRVNLEVKPVDMNLAKTKLFDSICHTWFIVKDKGVPINWKKPLL